MESYQSKTMTTVTQPETELEMIVRLIEEQRIHILEITARIAENDRRIDLNTRRHFITVVLRELADNFGQNA